MISVSKLYCGHAAQSDNLRYRRTADVSAADRKPIVVWNCTRACNLKCIHCYASSGCRPAPSEMSFEAGCKFIDDLAAFGAPVLLFSGGEPLCRGDLPELAAYAAHKGLRTVLSTNGTLITETLAERLKEIGMAYVGISLDGLKQTNDSFRGREGAFQQAMAGLRACSKAGLKVGLRYTITRHNLHDLPGIYELIETHNITRACFYHMVYSGRADIMAADDLSHLQSREVMNSIMDQTADWHARGLLKEILTVDNHCDGPFIYMRLLKEGRTADAGIALDLLKINGGNSSGQGIGCVSWDGSVYPDQFLRQIPLGNVLEKPFSSIWTDENNSILKELRDKKNHVTGKCTACRFLNVCGGNFRARALSATGSFWGVDPACYLTAEEISQ